MTSRTIDIHCRNCRRYLFSLWPDDTLKNFGKDYFCNKKACAEAATISKLNGHSEEVEIVKQ